MNALSIKTSVTVAMIIRPKPRSALPRNIFTKKTAPGTQKLYLAACCGNDCFSLLMTIVNRMKSQCAKDYLFILVNYHLFVIIQPMKNFYALIIGFITLGVSCGQGDSKEPNVTKYFKEDLTIFEKKKFTSSP